MISQRIFGVLAVSAIVFSLAGADLSGLFKYTPKNADSIVVIATDKLPAVFVEDEDVKKASAEYGLDLKDITGVVMPFRTGEDDYFGALVGINGTPQISQVLTKAGMKYKSVQIHGRSAYEIDSNDSDFYIIEFAPGVLLIVDDDDSADPFFTQADPKRGEALAKLSPDPAALVWAVVEVPAPDAPEPGEQDNDPGIRRVSAFCRLDQAGDKIDTTIKAILACKDANSANGCAMMAQMFVMPMILGGFSDDQPLAGEVMNAIKQQVSGNDFEITVTIPHALAAKLGEYGKKRANEMAAPATPAATVAAPAAAPASGTTR